MTLRHYFITEAEILTHPAITPAIREQIMAESVPDTLGMGFWLRTWPKTAKQQEWHMTASDGRRLPTSSSLISYLIIAGVKLY